MTPKKTHPRRLTRRWLKAVTLMLGVLMGLMVAMASASALQSVSEEHSCCCDHEAMKASKHDASTSEPCEHQAAESAHAARTDQSKTSKPCKMAGPSEGCPCGIDSGDNTPVGDSVALGANTFSFAPAVAATLHPQLDLPLARAPSAVSSEWLYGQSPPEHLFLLHQTFLI
jgi:hypothetical protein